MKKAIISNKGRRREVSADTLAHVRAMAKANKDATNADQIAVGRVLVEIEGEEPVDLVLPTSMIEMLLEGIGAGPVAAAPVEPLEEEVMAEARDADDAGKMDSKAITDLVDRRVRHQLDAHDRKVSQDAARRASVNADASTLLPAGYDFAVPWTQVALDAIVRAAPELEPSAKGLAARAAKGDAVAEGMLRQMLAERRVSATGDLKIVESKKDSNPDPWASDTMPGSEAQ